MSAPDSLAAAAAALIAVLGGKIIAQSEDNEGHTHIEAEIPDVKEYIGSGETEVSGMLSVSPSGVSTLNVTLKKYTVGLPDPLKPDDLDDQPTTEEFGD